MSAITAESWPAPLGISITSISAFFAAVFKCSNRSWSTWAALQTKVRSNSKLTPRSAPTALASATSSLWKRSRVSMERLLISTLKLTSPGIIAIAAEGAVLKTPTVKTKSSPRTSHSAQWRSIFIIRSLMAITASWRYCLSTAPEWAVTPMQRQVLWRKLPRIPVTIPTRAFFWESSVGPCSMCNSVNAAIFEKSMAGSVRIISSGLKPASRTASASVWSFARCLSARSSAVNCPAIASDPT